MRQILPGSSTARVSLRLFSTAGQTKLVSYTREAEAGLLVPWGGRGEGAGKESTVAWLAFSAGGLGLFLLGELFSKTWQLVALHSSSQPGSLGLWHRRQLFAWVAVCCQGTC